MRSFKTIATIAAGAALALSMTACSSSRDTTTEPGDDSSASTATSGGDLIGISMPTQSLERWNKDGAHLDDLLKQDGYETIVQFADNKPDQQISQIQNMINSGASVLVIAAIDGTTLSTVLEQAASQDITIIAYDRLINDTENVDYYATFDNYEVGQLQGNYIVDQLNLDDPATTGPFNLEPFAGSPDDNNARFFFSGAWDVLKPYVDSGKFVCPSNKCPASNDDWTQIGIQGWTTATAQSEMQNRLNSFYTGGAKVDVVLSPNDSLALGIEQALDGAGYTPGVDWPIVTGQDADEANVKNMLIDKQSMTVWKDTRTLGDQVAKMVDEIMTGAEVSVNDTETYDNGVKVVPTYLLPPQTVTKDTIESTLVQSGYYTADQLGI
ncbi:MAG: sugar-binding protein [Propionibacteriaceae bacterium]|nr:sugar-binding protein [Propionibacteriaceae bacterium]